MVNTELTEYIETNILPNYNHFDKAHRMDHVQMVIDRSLQIAKHHPVDEDMVYTIAAYHDMGLIEDRKTHHLVSGRILREDKRLPDWFSPDEIETMARAVEDHRASSDHEPRSLYGKIVTEADRFIDPVKIIERTIQFSLDHYPGFTEEDHWNRVVEHMHEKYAEGGYLKLWFPESPNTQRLEALRDIIRDERKLRELFNDIYSKLISH